ncbi:MAG TPA: hypothetical protein VI790_00960 [Candidatus Nanoarchaeia archaeon]|nr:hypothetical protein [Candidatus Nanoarchaeia archaeon]
MILLMALTIIWGVIFLATTPINCPARLGNDYFTCSEAIDCSFNPKYNCINQKPLNCQITEDLSAKQALLSSVICDCTNNKCETTFNIS